MPDYEARVNANRKKVREFLAKELPGILSGRLPDPMGIRKAVFAKVVWAALEDVKKDYEEKSKGGQGQGGIEWAPLTKFTIRKRAEAQKGKSGVSAGGKRHKQEQPPPDPAWLRAQRREVYRKEYARLRAGGLSHKEAARQASVVARFATARAWNLMAGLMRGEPGKAAPPYQGDFPILKETGRLLESASPGTVSGKGLGMEYQPPSGGAAESGDQEVVYGKGFVAVDSHVPYGDKHMEDGEGEETGGFRPARPWKYGGDVPKEWVDRWAAVMSDALAEVLADVLPRLGG